MKGFRRAHHATGVRDKVKASFCVETVSAVRSRHIQPGLDQIIRGYRLHMVV